MVGALKRRRTGSQLLAYRASDGWKDLTAEEVNAYLKQCLGGEFTAKDFRTWNATVLAAVALAGAEEVKGKGPRVSGRSNRQSRRLPGIWVIRPRCVVRHMWTRE